MYTRLIYSIYYIPVVFGVFGSFGIVCFSFNLNFVCFVVGYGVLYISMGYMGVGQLYQKVFTRIRIVPVYWYINIY